MKATARLRSMLREKGVILAPGAHDALTAKIIEKADFPVVYMSGYGAAASLLGRPDVGLLTMTEMVNHARNIVSAVSVPVIADADTGYGNPINVQRTVSEYENAGVAALHIEDQVWPKKCGHMTGKRVIPRDEMVQKVKAAVDARQDRDLVIIARTDARATHGIEEAIERSKAYADAGADVIFIEAPESRAELELIARSLETPLLFNATISRLTLWVPLPELEEMGFKIVIYPITALLAVTSTIMKLMKELRQTASPYTFADRALRFADFNRFIGLPEIEALESEYRIAEEP